MKNTLVLVGIGMICASCNLSGRFHKVEHFAEYAPDGRAAYYRVSVSGLGKNGKVDYRSGWYDARAVDQLFGNVGKEHEIAAVTAARHRRAIQTVFDRYMDALEGEAGADLEQRRAAYREAVSSVSGTTSLDGGAASPLDHADEKFVMVFSNDPEKVIEAIKGQIQSNSLRDSMADILRRDLERKDAVDRQRLMALIGQLDAVIAAVGEEARGQFSDAASESELARLVEGLLAQVEAVR